MPGIVAPLPGRLAQLDPEKRGSLILSAGRVIRCEHREKDANGSTMIFLVIPAYNRNLPPVAFNKLLCDEQADACSHGAAGRKEGFEYPWQSSLRNSDAVILNGQKEAVRGRYRIFHGDE